MVDFFFILFSSVLNEIQIYYSTAFLKLLETSDPSPAPRKIVIPTKIVIKLGICNV